MFKLTRDKSLKTEQSTIICKLDEKKSMVVVEIRNKLSVADFKKLSNIIDPWIERNLQLKSIVIHVKKFPFWKNLDGMIAHFSFIKNHHKKIGKIAISADGILPHIAPKLAKYFIKAEIKEFSYSDLERAKEWAGL